MITLSESLFAMKKRDAIGRLKGNCIRSSFIQDGEDAKKDVRDDEMRTRVKFQSLPRQVLFAIY